MPHKKDLRLYCFSPPIMLVTFLIEISFSLYVLWRYKLTTTARLVVAILAFLAVFQAAEFAVCGGNVSPNSATRLGYAAITLLPPLGIHLAHSIAKRKLGLIGMTAYATAAAFLVYFVFMTDSITGHTCYANYAVFDTHKASAQLYGLYYYGWLSMGTLLAVRWSQKGNKRQKSALFALAIGYTSFILPTTTANLIDPSTISGIPSIMCGFAVILAFILVGRIATETLKRRA